MKPLRLLTVIEAGSITGPAKNLLEFARLARVHGVETLIATFIRSPGGNLFIDTARGAGITVETIQERGAFDTGVVRSLAELTNRLKPDVIQTHAVKSHFLARCAGLPRHVPWVAFHHGYTWPDLKARAYNQLDRWSLRGARKVLTVSRPFREELMAHGVREGRIEIIHNAIPVGWGENKSPELRDTLEIPAGRKVILIVGRLSREKDHVTLLEAIARIVPLDPHLLIVGEGPERARIEEAILGLSLHGRVTFTGHRKSAEPYYGIADLAVLSSLSEGSPNALLEAMAAGVPAVATAVGGIPEIVTDGESALLVKPRDAEGLSAAMARALEDGPLARRMVKRSQELVREVHAPEVRVRTLIRVYRGLAATAPR